MYRVVLSRRAVRSLREMSERDRRRVEGALLTLQENPRTSGTIKLDAVPVASYRHRVGDYRILFDIDDQGQVVEVLDIPRRTERTYR